MTYRPGSVTVELTPKTMLFDFSVFQWSSENDARDASMPLTSHVQAAESAQNTYPFADKAVVTHDLDGSYEVQLFCNHEYMQTITFHP